MNVTVENLAPCKKLIRVEVEAEKVNAAFEAVTKDFQRQASLPGFRPGKAPKDMIVKRFSSNIEQEVKSKLTNDSYKEALREKKIAAVGYPDIEEIQFGKDQAYQFAATVETEPEFEVPNYKGLPAKKEKAQVTDADIDRALMMLRDRGANFETVSREVKEGDVAVVNYKGTCEGKPIIEIAPTARGLNEQKNFWVHMHKGSFIPGFADQLTGAKAGDKRTVNVDFPGDFVSPALQNKKGTYEVEIVEVKEKKMPELNDDFAKSFGAETVDKLKEGVRADLDNELKFKLDRHVREQVVDALLKQVQCELPETAVQHETRNLVFNIVNDNQRRGVPNEAIEAEKQKIYQSAAATAKDRVKASLIFGRIAEKENIKVEQQDIARRVSEMAAANEIPVDKLVKDLQQRNGFGEIYEQVRNEKVVEFLVQNAKIEEVEPAPESK